MIININVDWRIVSDPLQWIVQHRRMVKGQNKWDNKAYFGDLGNAVVWLARRQIMPLPGEYGPDALPALCQALDRIEGEIREVLDGIHSLLSESAETMEREASPSDQYQND